MISSPQQRAIVSDHIQWMQGSTLSSWCVIYVTYDGAYMDDGDDGGDDDDNDNSDGDDILININTREYLFR